MIYKSGIQNILCALLSCIIAVAVLMGSIFISTKAHVYRDITIIPTAEAILIPGAAILKNNDLSPILKDRADGAIALYQAHKAPKIIITGNSADSTYDEVGPIRKYLLNQDIPSSDIILDRAGFDTYSSMYRAGEVFGLHSIIIASQSFHLPRGIYIARHLGITSYGFVTDRGKSLWTNYVREIPASIKAVWNLLTYRKPEVLN